MLEDNQRVQLIEVLDDDFGSDIADEIKECILGEKGRVLHYEDESLIFVKFDNDYTFIVSEKALKIL